LIEIILFGQFALPRDLQPAVSKYMSDPKNQL